MIKKYKIIKGSITIAEDTYKEGDVILLDEGVAKVICEPPAITKLEEVIKEPEKKEVVKEVSKKKVKGKK